MEKTIKRKVKIPSSELREKINELSEKLNAKEAKKVTKNLVADLLVDKAIYEMIDEIKEPYQILDILRNDNSIALTKGLDIDLVLYYYPLEEYKNIDLRRYDKVDFDLIHPHEQKLWVSDRQKIIKDKTFIIKKVENKMVKEDHVLKVQIKRISENTNKTTNEAIIGETFVLVNPNIYGNEEFIGKKRGDILRIDYDNFFNDMLEFKILEICELKPSEVTDKNINSAFWFYPKINSIGNLDELIKEQSRAIELKNSVVNYAFECLDMILKNNDILIDFSDEYLKTIESEDLIFEKEEILKNMLLKYYGINIKSKDFEKYIERNNKIIHEVPYFFDYDEAVQDILYIKLGLKLYEDLGKNDSLLQYVKNKLDLF